MLSLCLFLTMKEKFFYDEFYFISFKWYKLRLCLCHYCTGLYHGIWNCEDAEFCTWRRTHGRQLYGFYCL